MKYGRRMILSIFWIVLGVALNTCYYAGLIEVFWSGMGAAFIGVGIVQLIRQIRYRTDTQYREKVDVELADERNKYIAGKAWAWAGYLFVLIAAAATIVLHIIDRPEQATMAGMSVCLLILLYWLSWMVLRKKY